MLKPRWRDRTSAVLLELIARLCALIPEPAHRWPHEVARPGTYYVVVDAYNADQGGAFSLEVTFAAEL